MNPQDPPPVGIDQVVATQMMIIQQMANMVTELQTQIRQEREKIRQVWLEIHREIMQAVGKTTTTTTSTTTTSPTKLYIYSITICKT
jgi:sensor domain CHASE-containing protein